jgi:uncharacterized membrane protein (DUF4010 family)
MADAEMMDMFQRLAMALGVGFLLGIERGWRHRDAPEGSRAAGLRTHAIIGLLGGVSGALLPAIGAVGFAALTLAFAACLLAFKLRESQRDNDVSVTGTLAALLVFALGAYAMWGDLRVVAATGVVLVGLMAFKDSLHDWLDRLSWEELRSALLILAATAIALPLLPDRAVDPWGAINPRELWLLTILVAGASFAGYAGVRVLGRDLGVLAGAAAGAIVSSTVVTAELGRRVRAGETGPGTAAAAAVLAAAISLTRTIALVALSAAPMLPHVGPALAAGALVLALATWILHRRGEEKGDANAGLHNPLDIVSVARFALLLSVVIVVGRLVADTYGQAGLLPFAATAGLADADAVTLAAGSLVRGGLSPALGAQAVLIGVLINTFSKGAIAWVAGGRAYGGLYLAAAAAAALATGVVWALAEPVFAPLLSSEASLGPVRIG